MNNYQSIATINAPEFINLQPLDINPMMSKCEIKVLYLGQNRNGTSINKQAATEMAKTLRGAPIVGYYKDSSQDFFDHGEQVIYDGDGVHFNCLTKPYGFVAPDAEVWFQEFEEFNGESSEPITRVYMMTTGYLWTGQYKEAQQIFNEGGKAQSMELDENSISGFWSKEENSDIEFFIINDAVFSKLCVLGDDVEPCFEGASITAPNISKTFSLDDKFKQTLYSMMKELQETIQGGKYEVADEIKKQSVDSTETIQEVEQPVVETPAAEQGEAENTSVETPDTAVVTETVDTGATTATEGASEGGDGAAEGGDGGSEGGDGASGEYAKKEDSEEGKKESTDDEGKDSEDKEKDDNKKKEDDKYSLLLVQFEELQQSFTDLQAKNAETEKQLAEFKAYALAAENEKKDALIAEFYMLSDEDKKDVIDHKAEYSLDEIKAKLAVLCYDKKVSYVKAEEEDKLDSATVDMASQYSMDMPAWLQAVEQHKNS